MNCRYREQYSKPKKIIENQSLGKLRYIRGTYIYNLVQSVKNNDKPWGLNYPKEINPLLHGGAIHCIDLLRWLGGCVKTVFAKSANFELQNYFNADTFLITLEFVNGALGELVVSNCAFRPNDFSIELWLSNGSITGTNIYKRKNDELINEPEVFKIEQNKIDLLLQLDDFIYAIENNCQTLNNFDEALENFNLINAIESSLKDNEAKKVNFIN